MSDLSLVTEEAAAQAAATSGIPVCTSMDIMRETSAPPLPPQTPAVSATTVAPARTKLVFLYSSDDEADDKDETKKGAPRTVVKPVDSAVPDPATLAELAADAEAQAALEAERQRALTEAEALPLPDFTEDLMGSSRHAPIPVAATSGEGSGMRVRVVEAHGLVEPQSARHGTHAAPSLRRLTVEEIAAAGGRLGGVKRFRDDGDEDSETALVEEEGGETRVAVVVAEDGATVAGVRSHGYVLSVNEAELMDDAAAWGTEVAQDEVSLTAGADGLHTSATAVEDPLAAEGSDEVLNEYLGEEEGEEAEYDDDGDEDDDEESGEDLDDVLFVAVVEVLVRCCEQEDLDPAMSREAARFLAEAKPLLAQLEAGEMDESAFYEKLDGSVRRFQRIFKAVYKPKDTPIIVDGVQMDM